MAKAVIFGAGGQVGQELLIEAPSDMEVVGFTREELDITYKPDIERVLGQLRPDIVINAAAYTKVDAAENEMGLAYGVNSVGAKNLAEASRRVGSKFVHISTDFVFNGEKITPYSEEDTPEPLNVYGLSKLDGEQYVLSSNPDSIIVRTSWVYSAYGDNFVKTMLGLMSSRDSISVVSDQVGSPTYAKGLAKVIWKLRVQEDAKGIYHWSDEGEVTWYEFAKQIRELGLELGLLDSPIAIIPISSKEWYSVAERPKYTVLNCNRIGIPQTNWKLNLRDMMEELL